MDPLQVFDKANTYTFHNADEDTMPAITTTASISPYGLPYGSQLDVFLCISKPVNRAIYIAGKTGAADSTWPFPVADPTLEGTWYVTHGHSSLCANKFLTRFRMPSKRDGAAGRRAKKGAHTRQPPFDAKHAAVLPAP